MKRLRKVQISVSLLEPDFDFVAVRIDDIGKGKSGRELAALQQPSARVLGLPDGCVDVGGRPQPEAKVNTPARFAWLGKALVECYHVFTAGRSHVNTAFFLKVSLDAENLLIKSKRAFDISNSNGQMCKTVSWYHDPLSLAARALDGNRFLLPAEPPFCSATADP